MIIDIQSLLKMLQPLRSAAASVAGPAGLRIEFTEISHATPRPAEEFDAGKYTVRLEKVQKDSEDWVVALEIVRKPWGL